MAIIRSNIHYIDYFEHVSRVHCTIFIRAFQTLLNDPLAYMQINKTTMCKTKNQQP